MGKTKAHKKAIAKRNRENAKNSTGPKTPEGKRKSAANALQHGLTADPERGIVDGTAYRENLDVLTALLKPTHILESAAVERIALGMFRLRRARIAEDAQIKMLQRAFGTDDAITVEWVGKIYQQLNKLAPACILGRERVVFCDMPMLHNEYVASPKFIRAMREVNEWFKTELVKSPHGMIALTIVAKRLIQCLNETPRRFTKHGSVILSWLLDHVSPMTSTISQGKDGDKTDEDAARKVQASRQKTVHLLVAETMTREHDEEMSALLTAMIDSLLQHLDTFMEVHFIDILNARLGTMVLPGDQNANLMRYEKESWQAIEQGLAALANYRGVSVHELMSGVSPSTRRSDTAASPAGLPFGSIGAPEMPPTKHAN